MSEELDNSAELQTENDLVDFEPDPSQLGRPRREPMGMPRWLIAALATAAILVVILMLRPGPATAQAAETPAEPAQPAKQDLFQLPEWHDQPDDAAANAAALKSAR